MAKPNISLLGATYSGVSGVTLPTSGGGTATFPWVEGSETKTANGTYDVTNLASLVVNVSGGGGTSNWKLLASKEFSVNTTSTSNTSVGNIDLPLSDYNNSNVVLWVHIRDKAGKRDGYYYGSDALFFPYQLATGNTNSLSIRPVFTVKYGSSAYTGAVSAYGVYAYRLYYTSSNHYVQIYRRYNSSTTGTINGTFKCDVYTLTMPTGMTLFT